MNFPVLSESINQESINQESIKSEEIKPEIKLTPTKIDISSTPSTSVTTQPKSQNSFGGILSSICCCICSFICFILLVRGLMPRTSKTIIQPMPMNQAMPMTQPMVQ